MSNNSPLYCVCDGEGDDSESWWDAVTTGDATKFGFSLSAYALLKRLNDIGCVLCALSDYWHFLTLLCLVKIDRCLVMYCDIRKYIPADLDVTTWEDQIA